MYSIYTATDCTKWNQRAFTFSTYFWEKWTGKQNAHLCNFYQIFCNFHVTLMVLSNLCYDETGMVPSNLPTWGNLEFQRHPVGLLDLLINRIKKVFQLVLCLGILDHVIGWMWSLLYSMCVELKWSFTENLLLSYSVSFAFHWWQSTFKKFMLWKVWKTLPTSKFRFEH